MWMVMNSKTKVEKTSVKVGEGMFYVFSPANVFFVKNKIYIDS